MSLADEQLRGPYRQWIHEHTFEARDGGTLARDVVRYAVPFDFLARRFFVRPDVEKIFTFRVHALKRLFAADKPVILQYILQTSRAMAVMRQGS